MRIFVMTKRTLIIIAAVVLLVILGLVLLLTMGKEEATPGGTTQTTAGVAEEYELEVLAGKKRELPVYSVERKDDKKIALTVDAAWEDDKTPFILEELDRQGIKATFYLCGFWADKYPENVKAIHDKGHELGNHGVAQACTRLYHPVP